MRGEKIDRNRSEMNGDDPIVSVSSWRGRALFRFPILCLRGRNCSDQQSNGRENNGENFHRPHLIDIGRPGQAKCRAMPGNLGLAIQRIRDLANPNHGIIKSLTDFSGAELS